MRTIEFKNHDVFEIAKCSTLQLVELFELTDLMNISNEVATVRGWLMDELEKRDLEAFIAWIDSEDDSPRKYFL